VLKVLAVLVVLVGVAHADTLIERADKARAAAKLDLAYASSTAPTRRRWRS
jgi:hypothetical protein